MHRLLMWIRLRYGLFWQKTPFRVLAEFLIILALFLLASVALGTAIQAGYELLHIRHILELQIKQEQHTSQTERLKVAKLEQIVVNCLNHDIVVVDGKIKICEL